VISATIFREGTGGKFCASIDNDSVSCRQFVSVISKYDVAASGGEGRGGRRKRGGQGGGEERGALRCFEQPCERRNQSLRLLCMLLELGLHYAPFPAPGVR
jgi:hypothetical protein